MGIKLNLPIKIKVDNVGAIYLAKNFSLSHKAKHINIRRHFFREHQVEGKFDATFVRLEDNKADILTKNTSEEILLCHQSKLMRVIVNNQVNNRMDVRTLV
jgi:nitrate/TMAO reductase-like tetraheme cytochrome c subunit